MDDRQRKKELFNSSEIVINHIQLYLKKMTKVLFYSLIFITIAEAFISILIKTGHFTYYLQMQNAHNISYNTFLFEVIIHNTLLWIVFVIYCILFKRASYNLRKSLYSITLMIITTILCFGHWKYSYLSILYCIPVCVTSPMGKKHSISVFISSIVITILYAIFQSISFGTKYNFLICVVSLLTIIVFFLISHIFFVSMTSAIYDVEKYCSLSQDLKIKVRHDSLTGAFSKVALYKDFESFDYKFKSMAFVDLDNFKIINDTMGHSIGDYILKALVRCFKIKNEKIYRYGGDEFVILSSLEQKDFKKELEDIKSNFVSITKGVLNCDTSFSAGITNIKNHDDNVDILIKKCDKAMYSAKKNGKNSIISTTE